mgnify:FL=1|tara:strand:- start:80 stop:328 length:249 start_codon:yes stop_codon:yes gene_type:complete
MNNKRSKYVFKGIKFFENIDYESLMSLHPDNKKEDKILRLHPELPRCLTKEEEKEEKEKEKVIIDQINKLKEELIKIKRGLK